MEIRFPPIASGSLPPCGRNRLSTVEGAKFPLEIEHLAAVPMAAILAYRGDLNTIETGYHALGQ